MTALFRLVRSELLRLRSRRAVLLLLGLAVLAPVLIGLTTTLTSQAPSARELASARAQAAADASQPYIEDDLASCRKDPAQYGVDTDADPPEIASQCEDLIVPSAQQYLSFRTLNLEEERDYGSGLAVVVLLGAVMFLLGTTFAGHDWNTGSMSNQLLFEPRRLRVWSAKVVAVGFVSALVTGLTVSVYWLGLASVVSGRDQPLTEGVVLDCLQFGWRGTLLATAAGIGGVTLTMLSRSTVFSLGLLLGVSVVGGLLLATVGPDDTGPVDPVVNAAAVLQDGTTYYVPISPRCLDGGLAMDLLPEGDPCTSMRTRSLNQGATWYAGWVLVVGAVSAVSFHRRDVP